VRLDPMCRKHREITRLIPYMPGSARTGLRWSSTHGRLRAYSPLSPRSDGGTISSRVFYIVGVSRGTGYAASYLNLGFLQLFASEKTLGTRSSPHILSPALLGLFRKYEFLL
jgi:hypothetical protein